MPRPQQTNRKPAGRLAVILGLLAICFYSLIAHAAPRVIYEDTFEDGAPGWTFGGTADTWALGTPTAGPDAAHSGSTAWATVPGGDYPNDTYSWLVSPPISLGDAPTLSFYYYFASEDHFDFGLLEISRDGIDYDIVAVYTGQLGGWHEQVVDLAAYSGETIRLRYSFYSDRDTTAAGWYIDDVRVTEPFDPATVLPAILALLLDGDGPDVTAPSLQFVAPANGDTVNTTLPDFTVRFSDAESGVDNSTFRLLINGIDVTAAAVLTPTQATYSPAASLPPGDNIATATIVDRAGNRADASSGFYVAVFRAIAECLPASGTAPLAVRFRSLAEVTGGSIVSYQWDFDGDGTFDTTDSVASDKDHTYATAGTYDATLAVTDNLGRVATDVCTIVVSGSAPSAVADATPSNGPIPLLVNLSCSGDDQDGSIAQYEWDFEGDGIFDYSNAASGNTTHTYEQAGTFSALCRVTDNDGLTGQARATTTVIRPALPGSPSVTASATPQSGDAPLTVALSGTATDDGSIVLWEWDFDGDGTYDHSSAATASVNHDYTQPGIYAATLRATDDDGNSGADGVEVLVGVETSLAIADDTFEPGSGETATISTVLSARLPVRLQVKNPAGTVVRTLVNATRDPGSYDDAWDGKDANGKRLAEGAYYAVLEYDIDGQTHVLDLTATTGGERYNPTRESVPNTFSPFDDDPLEISFQITPDQGASEITAFVGLYNTDTRFATLLERVPRGVGSHQVYWDGTDGDGNLAVPPPGDSFLIGLWGYELPDNAIYLQAAPELSDVSADPNFFDPATPGFLTPADPVASIEFLLSEAADVSLTVTNLETGRVLRRIVTAVDPDDAARPPTFEDDFESGAGGWTHGGTNDVWALGTPTVGPASANSGVAAWGLGLDGDYPNGSDNWLLSPPIQVQGDDALYFAHYFESESYYDGGIVEITTDGTNFTKLVPAGGYPYTNARTVGDAYSGSLGGWSTQTVALSDYAGQTVQVRFRFVSDGSVTRSGWFIDDVSIGLDPHVRIEWDGRADDGRFVDSGDYRLTLQAIDSTGSASLARYVLMRVFY
jgi:PKD repeat protein